MSYYTTIYPDVEKFSRNGFATISDLQNYIASLEAQLHEIWNGIAALCISVPKDIAVGDNVIDYVTKRFNDSWDSYMNGSVKLCHHYDLYSIWSEEAREKEYTKDSQEYKPSLWRNHFEYNSDPEEGVKDCKESIEYVKRKLFMLAISTPSEVFKGKDNLLDQVNFELTSLKEYLDRSISDLEFCKLCVEYWDTHTEG